MWGYKETKTIGEKKLKNITKLELQPFFATHFTTNFTTNYQHKPLP